MKKESWSFQFKAGIALMLFYVVLGVALACTNLWFLSVSVASIFGIVVLYIFTKKKNVM